MSENKEHLPTRRGPGIPACTCGAIFEWDYERSDHVDRHSPSSNPEAGSATRPSAEQYLDSRLSEHGRGNDVLLRNAYELNRETDLVPSDTAAIADAHTSLPDLVAALSKVLALHAETETGVDLGEGRREPDYCATCAVYSPCPTATAITRTLGVQS